MNSPATSTYLPPLEVNHECKGAAQELQATLREIEVVRALEKQQWMLRAQLGEHA